MDKILERRLEHMPTVNRIRRLLAAAVPYYDTMSDDEKHYLIIKGLDQSMRTLDWKKIKKCITKGKISMEQVSQSTLAELDKMARTFAYIARTQKSHHPASEKVSCMGCASLLDKTGA